MLQKKGKLGKRRQKLRWLLSAVGAAGLAVPVSAGAAADFELAPVVVTANRIPEKLVDTKADVSVVDRTQIEELHLQTVEAALRTVPGTQFLNYGVNGLNANLSGIRINGSKDVVVLIDGVRMTDFQGADNSGYMYASMLNQMDNIERIEVLRGSAGVVYGSGARGGVINIITRKIDRTKQTLDVSVGSSGKRAYRLNSMGRFGKVGYNAFFNKTVTGDQTDGAGKKWPGHTDMKSGGLKVSYDWTDDHTTTMGFDAVTSDYRGKDFVYSNRFHGDYAYRNFTVKDSWHFGKHWTNEFSYRYSTMKSDYYKDGETGISLYGISADNSYHFVTEQMHFSDSNNDLIVGFDYSKGTNHLPMSTGQYDEDGNRILTSGHYQKNLSLFIQDEWEFLPGWTLTGGIRHDRPSSDSYSADIKNHTSKSWKLSVELTDKDTIYGGRSDFYILPGLDKIYARWRNEDGTEENHGNAELLPAEGWTESIGYTHKFNDASAITFNWFKTKSTRSIGYSYDEDRYVNFNNGVARGWTLQFMSRIGKHWNFNLGWAHLYQNVPGDNLSMGYYPKDKLTFDVVYTKDKWQVGLDGFYFIRRKNPAYENVQGWPSDKYGVYNLSVNYSPNKDFTVYMKVDNIFDKLWAEHTDVVHHGKPGSWYSMPGRVVSIGARFSF